MEVITQSQSHECYNRRISDESYSTEYTVSDDGSARSKYETEGWIPTADGIIHYTDWNDSTRRITYETNDGKIHFEEIQPSTRMTYKMYYRAHYTNVQYHVTIQFKTIDGNHLELEHMTPITKFIRE